MRGRIAAHVRGLFDSGGPRIVRAADDPGLIARTSPAWTVHGDLASMMIGGLCALLLQMLHPAALAGVWDHSDFRDDRLGRLRRTARFVALTTYGGRDAALAAIDHVRRVHGRVAGVLPDGTRYNADDPALLTWVHVAEVDSFLRAYRRYLDPAMSGADQDRYLADVAVIAERLGAADVPRTRADIAAYYVAIRPQLRFDHRTRTVADALLARGGSPANDAALALAAAAAGDLLPDWAAAMHGRAPSPLLRPAVRAGADGMGRMLRWALRR